MTGDHYVSWISAPADWHMRAPGASMSARWRRIGSVMRKAREYDLTRLYKLCMRFCIRRAASSNAVRWLMCADAAKLDELRVVMLRYLRRKFRVVRFEAPETLSVLRGNPDLMLEVMMDVV